jgi:hypothetical protein
LWAESGAISADDGHSLEPVVRDLGSGICCFSSRRLYFPNARVLADLEWVWRVDGTGKELTVVFSALQKLITIRMVPDGMAASRLADFVRSLLAQREQRVAELPQDEARRHADFSGRLERSGILEAALAEPVPPPQTRVGNWLRALLLRDPELMARYRHGTEWGSEETPVLHAAFLLQVRRYFAGRCDESAIAGFMSSLGTLVEEKGQRVDLVTIETMIRSALDPSARGVDYLPPGRWLQPAMVTATFVCHDLEMSARAITLLVIQSEQMASNQGWNPPQLDRCGPEGLVSG